MLLDYYSPVRTDCSYIMNSNRPNLRVQGQSPERNLQPAPGTVAERRKQQGTKGNVISFIRRLVQTALASSRC